MRSHANVLTQNGNLQPDLERNARVYVAKQHVQHNTLSPICDTPVTGWKQAGGINRMATYYERQTMDHSAIIQSAQHGDLDSVNQAGVSHSSSSISGSRGQINRRFLRRNSS